MGYWGYKTLDSDSALDKMMEVEDFMGKQIRAEIDDYCNITGHLGSVMAIVEVIAKTPAIGRGDIDAVRYFEENGLLMPYDEIGCRLVAIRVVRKYRNELERDLELTLRVAIVENRTFNMHEIECEIKYLDELIKTLINEDDLRMQYENLKSAEEAAKHHIYASN